MDRRMRVSRGTWIGALAILAGAALVSFRSAYEPDLWWHLAQGREAAGGALVRTNLFSSLHRDYPQHYTSWLFDLGAYWLWTRAGGAALQIAQALLIAASLGLTALACRVRATTAATVAACLFGWLIIEPRALPRPYVFSFAAFAACVWLVERARATRSWRPLAWTVPLVVFWANVHVECVFGIGFVGLFGLCEWIRPRMLPRADAMKVMGLAALALLCTAINPYGFGLLRYLYENTLVPQLLNIAELRPPYLPNYRGFFVWTIVGGAVALLRWRTVSLAEAASIAVFGLLAFRHLRLTPLLYFVSAPVVARCIDELERFKIDRRAAAAAALVAVATLSRVPILDLVKNLEIGSRALTPPALFSEAAMTFARERGLAGPVFTSLNLGGFVAWELYPSARVFQDARLQAYPASHFRGIMEASRSREAWASLTAGVDWAVLSLPRVNELSGVGQFDPSEWGSAFRDQAIEIVVRRSGAYGRLAASARRDGDDAAARLVERARDGTVRGRHDSIRAGREVAHRQPEPAVLELRADVLRHIGARVAVIRRAEKDRRAARFGMGPDVHGVHARSRRRRQVGRPPGYGERRADHFQIRRRVDHQETSG
jgi:hypothetical protein